jgi:hypothetical protein
MMKYSALSRRYSMNTTARLNGIRPGAKATHRVTPMAKATEAPA